MKISTLPLSLLPCLLLLFHGCSEDKPLAEKEPVSPPPQNDATAKKEPIQELPVVYVEELDQFQEFFKEQHDTSFSHVTNKNWSSYTAGKNGILTKVMLYGKPNYMISEHYGTTMSGFIRSDNPETGPKYGEWSISREEIINQLALQGISESNKMGWITLQMRGEIPQKAGKLYFIVCDRIGDKRGWFGSFAFGDGNTYSAGRFWLHPDHDLVFRTYVGKTQKQLDLEQNGDPLFESSDKSIIGSIDVPEEPKPMIELSGNFEPATGRPLVDPIDQEVDTTYQPATEEPDAKASPQSDSASESTNEEASQVSEDEGPTIEESQPPANPTLFDRFFKEKSE